jgi:hypothetical protein
MRCTYQEITNLNKIQHSNNNIYALTEMSEGNNGTFF